MAYSNIGCTTWRSLPGVGRMWLLGRVVACYFCMNSGLDEMLTLPCWKMLTNIPHVTDMRVCVCLMVGLFWLCSNLTCFRLKRVFFLFHDLVTRKGDKHCECICPADKINDISSTCTTGVYHEDCWGGGGESHARFLKSKPFKKVRLRWWSRKSRVPSPHYGSML